MRIVCLMPLLLLTPALAQTAPRGGATRPSTAPAPATAGTRGGLPKSIDAALDSPFPLDADNMPLGDLTDMIRTKSQANVAVNWNALGHADITRETQVTLHLHGLTLEQVLLTLMEALPATGTRPNYTVGENALQITTNAEIGTEVVSKLFDLGRASSYSWSSAIKPEEQQRNVQIVAAILRAELVRVGEPPDAKGHQFILKDNLLLSTASQRGQGFINRAVALFNQPLKVGQLLGGTQFTSQASKMQEAYNDVLAKSDAAAPNLDAWHALAPQAIARHPEKYPQLNVALLPGVKEELAKEKPDLMTAVSDSGALLIGPADVIGARTLLAVYDLRDVLKKVAAKSKISPAPEPGAVQQAVVQVLQTEIKPEGGAWGGGDDLGKKPAIMIPYNGTLVVFATASTHRTIVKALQDLDK